MDGHFPNEIIFATKSLISKYGNFSDENLATFQHKKEKIDPFSEIKIRQAFEINALVFREIEFKPMKRFSWCKIWGQVFRVQFEYSSDAFILQLYGLAREEKEQ